MTLTFVSNYINHHQLPFCDTCYQRLGAGFAFVQSMPMEAERVEMGWSAEGETRPYVHKFDKEKEKAFALIRDSDILLAGWHDKREIEAAVQKRLVVGKPTFRISESIYKSGRWKCLSPRGLLRNYREHTRHRRRPYYLLCAGAYVAGDYRLLHAFPHKKYRWGYFPATRRYGEELWQKKQDTAIPQICWAGRFIDWKHPDMMLALVRDLCEAGHAFHLHLMGSGAMEGELKQMAKDYQVTEKITFHGSCSPEQVREIMEASHIHILASDRLEGWGAVLNEAMNSGLAVVASMEAGATGYLVADGENGFVFRQRQYEQMKGLVERLLTDAPLRERLGRAAYQTITETWNAEHAAEELLRVCAEMLAGREIDPAQEGPLCKT
jgi:glycosyltransferase involved in cell wall biosynthesis